MEAAVTARPQFHSWSIVGDSKLIQGEATDFEMGFIVGLIEGEGSIGFTLSRAGNSKFPSPFITIANTNLHLLEKAQAVIGGTVVNRSKGTNRRVYGLVVARVMAVYETLKRLVPYLEGKKEDAELVREWCELRLKRSKKSKPTKKEMDLVKKQWKLHPNMNKRHFKTRQAYLKQIEVKQ